MGVSGSNCCDDTNYYSELYTNLAYALAKESIKNHQISETKLNYAVNKLDNRFRISKMKNITLINMSWYKNKY